MTCEKARNLIAENVADHRLPFGARLHLHGCPVCALEAARMTTAIDMLRSSLPARAPDLSSSIMAKVRLEPKPDYIPVRFRDWLIVGGTLLAAVGFSPLGSTFVWLKENFGIGFLLPLNIVLGLGLAAYCALFIGTHLDEFSKKLNLKHY